MIAYGAPELQLTGVVYEDCSPVRIETQSLVVVSPFSYFYLFRQCDRHGLYESAHLSVFGNGWNNHNHGRRTVAIPNTRDIQI